MQDGKILQIVCTTMYIYLTLKSCTGLPGGSAVKSPPAYVGDVGTIPGLERSLEKGMATHSSPMFLPGKSQGQRSLLGYSPWDHKRVKHNFATKQQF